MQLTTKATDPRTIVVLVGSATAITLVGHLADVGSAAPTTKLAKSSPALGDAQILIGGTAAAVILTLIGTAGDVGATFAKGTALVLLLASISVYGGPVVGALQNVTGQAKATTAPVPAAKAPTTTKKAG